MLRTQRTEKLIRHEAVSGKRKWPFGDGLRLGRFVEKVKLI